MILTTKTNVREQKMVTHQLKTTVLNDSTPLTKHEANHSEKFLLKVYALPKGF